MNIPSLQGNWVDLVIIAILAYFVVGSAHQHVISVFTEFFAFFFSLTGALFGYSFVARVLVSNFSLPRSFANALGFLITATLLEVVVAFLLVKLAAKLPQKLWKIKAAKILKVLPALGEGIVVVAFLLVLAISLPINPNIKGDITTAKIGSYLLAKTEGIEGKINLIFGDAVRESLTYLTVKPGSDETLPLNVPTRNLMIDEVSEEAMVGLVNAERAKIGIIALVPSDEIKEVARQYAKTMWEGNYFSHYSPDGGDVGDRLTAAKIYYTYAGENLALAPTLIAAHSGLMNSEGHRANILDANFRKVGIGVISNSIYGKMFVQVFTN